MKSLARSKPLLNNLFTAGFALAIFGGAHLRTANAQSLTLSFRFDDGTANPAADYATLATSKTITSTNNGQTFTIDVFATVTGTSGTLQSRLGLQSILYRALLSSVNNSAFSTGSGVGQTGTVNTQYSDAGAANPPYALGGAGPWAFFNAANTVGGTGWAASSSGTIGDWGTTSNGTNQVAATSGVRGFGGPNAASSTSALAGVSDGTSYLTSTTGGDVSAINVAGANSTTFDLAQFQFKIGNVNAAGKTTLLPALPLLFNANNIIATYKITASTAINATGNAPYTIDTTGVSFVATTRQTGSASWNSNGNGNYNNMFNWDPNQIPDGAALVATLGNGTTTAVNVPTITVTVDAPERVGTLNFSNTNGTSFILGNDGVAGHALTLDNNGAGGNINSLTGNNSIFSNLVLADNATFNIAAGSSVLVSVGNITESGASRSITKTGAGTLTIDTASGYTGQTLVSAGTLVTTATGTLSAGPLVVNAANGVTSLVSLNNNQSVSSLSGADSSSGVATVRVGSGTTLTVAQSGSATFDGSLSLATGGALVKSGGGSLETRGAPSLGDGGSISVSGGTLRFNVTAGAATVGTGVAAAVSGAATLELAGSVSALSSSISAAHRVDVANNSSAAAGLLVSGTNQQVGGISGAGSTSVAAGGSLTANHIIQSALIIGGTAGSHGFVTISPSSASGNPLDQSSGFASVGSLTPGDSSGEGVIGSANLSSGDSMDLAALSGGNSAAIGNSSPVPEPSTLLLAFLAALGVFSTQFTRHHFRRQTV